MLCDLFTIQNTTISFSCHDPSRYNTQNFFAKRNLHAIAAAFNMIAAILEGG
jgi:hypothetical protein